VQKNIVAKRIAERQRKLELERMEHARARRAEIEREVMHLLTEIRAMHLPMGGMPVSRHYFPLLKSVAISPWGPYGQEDDENNFFMLL